MKLLLDTHVLLWWLRDDQRLGQKARALIADPRNEVMTSIASLWEIAIKHRIGKIDASGAAVARLLPAEEIALLPITTAHLAALEALPRHHGDPFDHLILAQGKAEGAGVMTGDAVMARYGVRVVGCG